MVDSNQEISWQNTRARKVERGGIHGHRAGTIWFTGLSGAGKSTLAFALEKYLVSSGALCFALDGDKVRHGLSRDLGFSIADRSENIRRAAEVAKLMNDAGLIVIAAFISPLREDREQARQIIGDAHFAEVHIATPLEVCESRDPKGLYRKARKGEIPQFTGIDSPYEPPETPDLKLDTSVTPVSLSLSQLADLAYARWCVVKS